MISSLVFFLFALSKYIFPYLGTNTEMPHREPFSFDNSNNKEQSQNFCTKIHAKFLFIDKCFPNISQLQVEDSIRDWGFCHKTIKKITLPFPIPSVPN